MILRLRNGLSILRRTTSRHMDCWK